MPIPNKFIITLLLGFCLTSTTFSQSFLETSGFQHSYVSEDTNPRLKNPGLAVLFSLGTPILSVSLGSSLAETGLELPGALLILGGMLVGPSAGNYYAGNSRAAKTGLFIRGTGTVLLTVGLLSFLSEFGNCLFESDSCGNRSTLFAEYSIYIGLGMYVFGFLYDVVTAPINTIKFNKEAKSNVNVSMAPTFQPEWNAPGVALRVRF